MAFVEADERKAKVDLTGPESECPALPPLVHSQVDVAFLGPSAQHANQRGFAAAGRPGDHDLPESHVVGDENTFQVARSRNL